MGKPDFRFAALCATLLTVAMFWVSRSYDLPINDPDGNVVPFSVRLPLIVLPFWIADVVYHGVRQRHAVPGRGLAATVIAVIKDRWGRAHLVFAATGLATWYVCYLTFRNLKSYVPFVNPTIHDDWFLRLDRTLWFGHDPALVLHSWFGSDLGASFFSTVYVSWLGLIPISLAIALVWTRALAASSWFVTAVAIDWLLGVAIYFVAPTLGPVYSRPEWFAGLRRTFSTVLDEALWRDRMAVLPDPSATSVVQTIAAFPSLHVGMMVTLFVMTMYLRFPRWIQVLAWIYLGLTVLATIYLGWHFSVDALGGAAVGVTAVWLAAWGTGNHVRGVPRLVPIPERSARPAPAVDAAPVPGP